MPQAEMSVLEISFDETEQRIAVQRRAQRGGGWRNAVVQVMMLHATLLRIAHGASVVHDLVTVPAVLRNTTA
eukprot:11394249-Alexandrium_andersonii.AAC.1